MKKSVFCGFLALVLAMALLPVPAEAEETGAAEELSSRELVAEEHGFQGAGWLFDGQKLSYRPVGAGSSLTLEQEGGIGSLYLIFNREYGAYTLCNEDTGEKITLGERNFLHDFVDLAALFGEAPEKVTLVFPNGNLQLNELRAFGPGEVPGDVQKWKTAPEDGVDLMLFSAHGDDEQLFFAGVLPYYAGELGYEVQVSYMTRHQNYGTVRPHEMLDGLWAVGVTNYPVFGDFADYYCENLNQSYHSYLDRGTTDEELLSPVVEQLRRFKPLVALGHDVKGEYGHGMHMLYSDLLQRAVQVSGDPEAFPESAEKWGTWEVPKTYLHLYPEGKIHMNWDIPLEHFGGMTAYQVSKELGFPAHESQYSGFAWYMADHDRAEDIPEMGPCDFGLYRSTVGEDVEGKDFFENLTVRAEQKRLAEEAEKAKAMEEARAMEETTFPATEPTVPGTIPEEAFPEPVSYLGLAGILGILAVLIGALFWILSVKRRK